MTGGRLRRMDDRLLPSVRRVLRRFAGVRQRLTAASGSPGRLAVRAGRLYPAMAATGVVVLIAGVLVAATGGDRGSSGDSTDNQPTFVVATATASPSPAAPPLVDGVLGPAAGDDVSSYLVTAGQRLAAARQVPADTRLLAVVDLNDYESPGEVSQLVGAASNVQVERVYARVPPPATVAVHALSPASVGDIAALLAADRRTARRNLRIDRKLLARHDTGSAARSVYRAQIRTAKAEVRGLTPTCRCLFALAVSGPAGAITALANQPSVRVLDPAPPGQTVTSVSVAVLQPQSFGQVPAISPLPE